MYAGIAFIIIQVLDILIGPLGLPAWIETLAIILLSVGFPIVGILAWIFDLTSEGIRKTESIEELAGKEIQTAQTRRRLKASDFVIVVMAIAIIILVWPKIFKPDALKRLQSSGEKISVAVMPFQNLTNDTTWNILQDGIQQSLISFLSNTGELKVREKESIKTLLQNKGLDEYASISPAIAVAVSKKLDAEIFINGSIQQAGPVIRVDAQLIDTKTKDVIKSFNIERPSNEKYIFQIIDTLSQKLKNYLLISKLIKGNPEYDLEISPLTTDSPEALKYYIYGGKALAKGDNKMAISWYLKSLDADSNYFDPMLGLSSAYSGQGLQEQNYSWVIKYYNKRKQWPPLEQLWASWAYAFSFEPPEEAISYLKQIQEIIDLPIYILGYSYNRLKQYNKAIPEFEKVLEMLRKWGKEFLKDSWDYYQLGHAYHQTGQYTKEKKLIKEWGKYTENNPHLIRRQVAVSLAEKDTIAANRYINKFKSACKEKWSSSEADINQYLAWIYWEESDEAYHDKAEEYFRKALSIEPEDPDKMTDLALFLIDRNRNLDEVSELMDNAMKQAKDKVDYYNYSDTKGWGLFKQGKVKEALEVLQKTWDEAPFKLYSIKSHLEEVKKTVAEQK